MQVIYTKKVSHAEDFVKFRMYVLIVSGCPVGSTNKSVTKAVGEIM